VAQPIDLFPDLFEWPADQEGVIPDARLFEDVEDAHSAAREALGRAGDGKAAARQAKMREGVGDFIGLGAKPMTIAGGTVMTAVPYDGEYGPMLGEVDYPSGARMVGLFGPDVGRFEASEVSALDEFIGWVWGATTANPAPADGVFRFRNGESFTGKTYNAGETGKGYYASADGERRFVGEIDFSGGYWRPVRGIVEDRKKRLKAVVGAGS
jgi:hypothetical protein